MSRKKTTATPLETLAASRYRPSEKAKWEGYVNVQLDADQRAAYESWLSEYEDSLRSSLADTLAMGVKLSIVWSETTNSFISTFIMKPSADLDERVSLSSFAQDPFMGVYLNLYKLWEVAKGDLSWYRDHNKTERSWG
jgi:hypothetical protein